MFQADFFINILEVVRILRNMKNNYKSIILKNDKLYSFKLLKKKLKNFALHSLQIKKRTSSEDK